MWLIVLLTPIGAVLGCWLWARRGVARQRELARQLAERTEELAVLNAVAAVVGRSPELDEVLVGALEATLTLMAFEAGGIYLLDQRDGVLKLGAHCGLGAKFAGDIDRLQPGEGFSGLVTQSGQALVIGDVSRDSRLTRTVVREEGFHSLAVIPLTSRDQVRGTLFVMTREHRRFSARDVQLLESIGHQLGAAIESAWLHDDTRRRIAQLTALQETARAVASTLELDRLLNLIIQQATTLLHADGGIINLVDWNTREDEVVATTGLIPLRFSGRHPLEGSLSGWVSTHNQPIIVNHLLSDTRVDRAVLSWLVEEHIQSAAVAPLTVKERVLGTLVLVGQQERKGEFVQSDMDLLVAFANQAATAIENVRLFDAEQRRAEQFRVITEVGRQITSMLDIDEALVQLVRLIREAFRYYHVAIGLLEGDTVVYRFGAGGLWHNPAFDFHPSQLKVGQEGLTGWVAGSGEPLIVPDVSCDPRYVWMEGSLTCSELLVPIRAKGEIIGVLDVQSDRLNDFDESDLVTMQSLADQAAVAIQNARLYAQAQQAAVLEERQRLARELHDAVTQTLFSASLIAEALPASWHRDVHEGMALLDRLRQLNCSALAEMRTLLLELRPAALVEARLTDLLRQLADAIAGREGLPVTVAVEDVGPLPPEVHVAFYRTAQEALNNVVKHSRASRAEVSLRRVQGTGVELVVCDDGRGFDLEQAPADGLGLGIMRERAQAIGALLAVESGQGQGTQVRLVWAAEEKG
ncbi:MAG: GAF domain-containing protein [Anaerolineae bacterium]|nr:GAF domain-containing protein [Anaerolineae bacterium]